MMRRDPVPEHATARLPTQPAQRNAVRIEFIRTAGGKIHRVLNVECNDKDLLHQMTEYGQKLIRSGMV